MKGIFHVAVGLLLLTAGCEKNQQAAGYTGVLEGTTVDVPAMTGGKIVQMRAVEGREVAEGDTLAQIDTVDLEYQKQELEASLDELAIEKEIAQTAVLRATTDLKYAQQKYGRVHTLLTQEAAPRQNADDVENRVQLAQLARQAALQQAQLLDAKRAQVVARMKTLQKKISDATVVAPVGGMVETRYFEAGEAVPPMRAVVELIHVKELKVKIYVPEPRLPEIRPGQTVTVRADGLNRSLPGRVSWVSDQAEFTPKTVLTPETRTSLVYAVTITVPNPDRVLKHGMPVEVRF